MSGQDDVLCIPPQGMELLLQKPTYAALTTTSLNHAKYHTRCDLQYLVSRWCEITAKHLAAVAR